MPKPRILLSGGTGFLGQWVLPLLQEKFEVDVLSRGGKTAVKADLTRWNAGIEDLENLRSRKYAAFVHLAGLYDLTASKENCFLQNVSATSIALGLCKKLDIPVFINTSSVAAAINSKLQLVKPYDLNFGAAFPDGYSESKAYGERMIENWEDQPRLRVNLRPGVLVGDSKEGNILRIDGPYYAPQALQRLRAVVESFPGALPLPGNESVRLPFVPVDACARAVAGILDWALQSGENGYKSYHLTPPRGLPIREFYKTVFRHLYLKKNDFRLMDKIPDHVLKKISKWVLRFPEEELSYLLKFPGYDASGTVKILGENWCPEFESYERAFWGGYEQFVSNR